MAALLVAVYHIWFNRVSGGVDVFFVVAAFFMMTSFAKRGDIGSADLLRYWSATFRRVCPVMVTVICATLAALWLLDARLEWRGAILHATASTLFPENWWLAWTGTDYLAQDEPPSPFQQMWALSLQMQFAVALPLLLWAARALSCGTVEATFRAWSRALTGLCVLSFGYGVVITWVNQPWAYFDGFARAWEYGAGTLLALYLARLPRPPRPWLVAMAGAALIVLAGFAAVLPVGRLFPGIAAVIPVGCALMLIYAARAGTAILPLRWTPALVLGDISFAFYLWHWPILVLWRRQTDLQTPGLLDGLCIILLSGVLAAASVRWIERPVREQPWLIARPIAGLVAGLGTTALAAVVIGAFALNYTGARHRAEASLAAFTADTAGFRAVHPRTIVPDPLLVRVETTGIYDRRCHQGARLDGIRECVYGDPDAAHTIVVHGGSHSVQWLPALIRLAPELDLRIVQITKVSCPTYDPAISDDPRHPLEEAYFASRDPSCPRWNTASLARILEIAPDAVLTIATRGSGIEEHVPPTYSAAWETIIGAGIPMLVIRDNPRFPFHVPSCVDRHRNRPEHCERPRDELLARDDPGATLTRPGLSYVDSSALFCGESTCWAERGGVLVYRDAAHLTGTYAELSAGLLRDPLRKLLEADQLIVRDHATLH